MTFSYKSFFLLEVLILTLGTVSCKNSNQEFKAKSDFPFVTDTYNYQTQIPLPQSVVKKKLRNLKTRQIFPKINSLQNLTDSEVFALLGPPSFKRSDNAAEIWQYRNYNCTLDLFLYESLDTTAHKVAYYEVRLKPGQGLTKSECFKFVIKSSNQKS